MGEEGLTTYVPPELYAQAQATLPATSTYGGQGDYAELMELMERAEQGVRDMRETGCQYALNRQAYEMAKARRTLGERMKGTPVTVIPLLVQGYEDVSEARMLKDASEALYAAAKESVNVAKLKARIVEAQINREWYQQPQM